MWAVAGFALVMAAVVIRSRRSGLRLGHFLGLGLVYLYARLWHGWTGTPPAPLPRTGPALLVANHTCSADPAFVTAGCRRLPSFILAGEYYGNRLLDLLFDYLRCVPVARNGRDVAGARASLRRLLEGCLLVVFPEGGLSHVGRGQPGSVKAGAAWLALRSRAPVYPALIRGGPQTSDSLRSWLRPSRVRVTFGDAVDLSDYYGLPINRKLLEEVTQVLMDRIAALAPKPTRARRRG